MHHRQHRTFRSYRAPRIASLTSQQLDPRWRIHSGKPNVIRSHHSDDAGRDTTFLAACDTVNGRARRI
jgi:hypothetical protein